MMRWIELHEKGEKGHYIGDSCWEKMCQLLEGMSFDALNEQNQQKVDIEK